MAYEKQNFQSGQILEASQLNHIEDGIVANETALEDKASLSGSNTFHGNITISKASGAKIPQSNIIVLDPTNSSWSTTVSGVTDQVVVNSQSFSLYHDGTQTTEISSTGMVVHGNFNAVTIQASSVECSNLSISNVGTLTVGRLNASVVDTSDMMVASKLFYSSTNSIPYISANYDGEEIKIGNSITISTQTINLNNLPVSGLVLNSSNGYSYKLVVDDSGNLSTTLVAEP